MKPKSIFAINSINSLKSFSRGFADIPAGRFSFPQKPVLKSDIIKQRSSPAINIDQLIDNNILGVGKSPQVIKDGKPNKLAGKVVTFDDPWKSETLTPNETSNDFSIVLSCGLGGGGSESNLYKSYFAISRLLDKDEVAVYSSLNDSEGRQERFRKGLPYYYDQSYVNVEESQNFFEQVLQKRFFKEDGNLKDPRRVSDLVLFGFSIGHRENISHANYLHNKITEALVREGKSTNLIRRYFEKIALVNIGSPVNWSDKKVSEHTLKALEKGDISPSEIKEEDYVTNITDAERKLSKVNIVNFRSVFDMGTAKPKADFNNFHCNSLLYKPEVFKFARPNCREHMYLLGAGKVRDLYFDESSSLKDNSLGHELINYARAIFDSEGAKRPILALTSSTKSDISVAEPDVRYSIYNPDLQPSEEDRENLKKEWQMELTIREVKKEQFNYNNSR